MGKGSQAANRGHSGKNGDAFTVSWFADSDSGRKSVTEAYSMYAISEVITVIPEPSAAFLLSLGGLALLSLAPIAQQRICPASGRADRGIQGVAQRCREQEV